MYIKFSGKFVEVLGWGINHSKLNVHSCYTNRLTVNKNNTILASIVFETQHKSG